VLTPHGTKEPSTPSLQKKNPRQSVASINIEPEAGHDTQVLVGEDDPVG